MGPFRTTVLGTRSATTKRWRHTGDVRVKYGSRDTGRRPVISRASVSRTGVPLKWTQVYSMCVSSPVPLLRTFVVSPPSTGPSRTGPSEDSFTGTRTSYTLLCLALRDYTLLGGLERDSVSGGRVGQKEKVSGPTHSPGRWTDRPISSCGRDYGPGSIVPSLDLYPP